MDIPQNLPAALASLRDALAAEGLGVVSEVDVQATLNAKLGLESAAQKLLGICMPKVAHALLEAEPLIGALLPCGGYAREVAANRTRVVLQDPDFIAAASANAAVHEALGVARAALLRVVQRLQSPA